MAAIFRSGFISGLIHSGGGEIPDDEDIQPAFETALCKLKEEKAKAKVKPGPAYNPNGMFRDWHRERGDLPSK